MYEVKLRLKDPEIVEAVDLWLASGTVRLSRTALLNHLFEAFAASIMNKTCTLDNVAECVATAIKISKPQIEQHRMLFTRSK